MASQERLKHIFTDEDGESIEFYIHESVKEKREQVIKAIERHGGEVVDTDLGVDTVVVDPHYPATYILQTKYRVHSDRRYWHTRVEDTEFVYNCIKIGKFKHKPVKRQAMRGNRPGRVDYTKKDEEMLCRYLAIRTPNAESGGRLGHRIYQDLVDLGTLDPKEYGWALRHPPESWREHYRSEKNRSRMDALIRRYVPKLNATEEQLYPFDRRLNRSWPPPYNERMEEHPQENFDQYWQHRNRWLQREQIDARQEEEEESSDEEPEAELSDDEYHRPSSLFSVEEEADGDGAPKNLDNPNVSARERHIPDQPDNSQVTLVGQISAFKSPIRPSQVSRGAAPSQTNQEDLDEEDEGEGRSGTPSPEATAVAGRAESPQMPVPHDVSNSVQDLSRRTGRAAQAAPVADAPYRNTRARSVEAPPIIALQTRRRKRNIVVEPLLSPPVEAEEEHSTKTPIPNIDRIEEATGGDLVQKPSQSKGRKRQRVIEEESPENNQEPVSVPETLHEEADVALMLAVQSIGSSTRSSIQQQQQSTRGHFSESGKSGNPGSSHLEHARSMDTDDEQIDKKLNSSNVPQWAKVPNPLDLLKGFNNNRTSGRPSLAASTSSSARTTQPLLIPKIEKTEHTDEFLMTPSEYSFPLPGTRANVAKKRYEEERKKEEYVPPPSTRAARSKRTSRK